MFFTGPTVGQIVGVGEGVAAGASVGVTPGGVVGVGIGVFDVVVGVAVGVLQVVTALYDADLVSVPLEPFDHLRSKRTEPAFNVCSPVSMISVFDCPALIDPISTD